MQLVLFKYQEDRDRLRNVRTVEIDGEVWFVASDVTELLGYSNGRDSVIRHCKSKGVVKHDIPTSSGSQSVTLINESNVYRLIVKSKLPTAEKFEEWLFDEVIPSIRKTGGYGYSKKAYESKLPNFTQRYKANIKNVKPRFFSVINELYIRLFAALEGTGYIIPDSTLEGAHLCPDISVGKAFSVYLKQHNSTFLETREKYMHEFPDGRKPVEAFQYPVAALDVFYNFIFDYWIPNCAEKYFKTRDPKALDYLPKLLPPKAS